MDLSKYQPNRDFLLYKSDSGDIRVDVMLQNESIWLPQSKIAELFGVNIPAISKHLKNIFESGELDEKVVVSILEITTPHGAIAEKEYEKYKPIQDKLFESDFYKYLKKLMNSK